MVYYFRNKSYIIDIRIDAKVEQIYAIVTTRNVSCYFLIKAECVTEKIKSLKVKLVMYKTYNTETAFE